MVFNQTYIIYHVSTFLLVSQMEQIIDTALKYFFLSRKKLQTSVTQWQEYDQQYDVLSQWLKDTDVQIRSESTLKPDLDSKREQLKTLKVIVQQSCHLLIQLDCL